MEPAGPQFLCRITFWDASANGRQRNLREVSIDPCAWNFRHLISGDVPRITDGRTLVSGLAPIASVVTVQFDFLRNLVRSMLVQEAHRVTLPFSSTRINFGQQVRSLHYKEALEWWAIWRHNNESCKSPKNTHASSK